MTRPDKIKGSKPQLSKGDLADELAFINQVGQAFNSTLDLDQVLHTVLEEVSKLLNIVGASLWLCHFRTDELVCRQAIGVKSGHIIGWRLAMGQGLTGQVAQTGETLIVADTRTEAYHFKGIDQIIEQEIRSLLSAPLRVKGEVIGVLNLVDNKIGRFTEDDLQLLEPIAAAAANAIKNAQLFHETQSQRRVAESLREIATIINSNLDQENILGQIMGQLAQVIPYDGGEIFLHEGNDLVISAGTGFIEVPVGYRIPLTKSTNLVVQIFKNKRSLLLTDTQTDTRWHTVQGGERVRSYIGVPLLAGERAIGVLTADSFEVNTYSQEDVKILETFAIQAAIAIQNHRLLEEAQRQQQAAEKALADLKITQAQLIHQEKMASLGMLTAGIAHEIKNPLNFVTSFAQLSIDLARELQQLLEPISLDLTTSAEIDEILKDLQFNATSINEEGQRANAIVQSMLLHSRGGYSERQETDVNSLLREAVTLAFHSMRAKNINLDIVIDTDIDPTIEHLTVIPQDLSRVFVNLINNAYEAILKKERMAGQDYKARLIVGTRNYNDHIEIHIRDNGPGISNADPDKLFTPFFTTKPTGEGTGLGLFISHDIIVHGHGGSIRVNSEIGQFTEFIISLPKEINIHHS